MQSAQHARIGLELRRKQLAQLRQRPLRVETVGVRGLVVDNPPGLIAVRQRFCSGAKYTVHLHRVHSLAHHSCPARLARSLSVRRQNPLPSRVAGSLQCNLQGLRSNAIGLTAVNANRARMARQSAAPSSPMPIA